MKNHLEKESREICEFDLRLGGQISEFAMRSAVDRYWPVVANKISPHQRAPRNLAEIQQLERGVLAYRALCRKYV